MLGFDGVLLVGYRNEFEMIQCFNVVWCLVWKYNF